MVLGGWPIKYEKGLFDGGEEQDPSSSSSSISTSDKLAKVKERISQDLAAAISKLPPQALTKLRKDTPIYINKTQRYGPKCLPVTGRGMCFHPGQSWLTKNGMSSAKAGCVELYQTDRYCDHVDLWYGKGGIMLHELAHAYHSKFCKGGYGNTEIKRCYQSAMDEGLYDCVEVHEEDRKKGRRRAYACTDPMEYFAELSAAFLGGVGEDEELEFNKWFPFNRREVKEHDPRAYELLKKMWCVDD